MARMTLRIDLDDRGSIGPGKVRLLELIEENGSIKAAGVLLKMSYARAWKLVQDLNATFGAPVLTAAAGGKSGGGARLTVLGRDIVAAYRAAERKATKAANREIKRLDDRALRTKRPKRDGREIQRSKITKPRLRPVALSTVSIAEKSCAVETNQGLKSALTSPTKTKSADAS